MAQTANARRTTLNQALALVQELIKVNEAALRLETQLKAAGESDAEVVLTVNKMFTGMGPPVPVNLSTGDTTTDRIINLLVQTASWVHTSPNV